MKQTPIHVLTNRIKRLPLAHQIAHLRALVTAEPLRSIRRDELESLLKDRVTRQLRMENKRSAA